MCKTKNKIFSLVIIDRKGEGVYLLSKLCFFHGTLTYKYTWNNIRNIWRTLLNVWKLMVWVPSPKSDIVLRKYLSVEGVTSFVFTQVDWRGDFFKEVLKSKYYWYFHLLSLFFRNSLLGSFPKDTLTFRMETMN